MTDRNLKRARWQRWVSTIQLACTHVSVQNTHPTRPGRLHARRFGAVGGAAAAWAELGKAGERRRRRGVEAVGAAPGVGQVLRTERRGGAVVHHGQPSVGDQRLDGDLARPGAGAGAAGAQQDPEVGIIIPPYMQKYLR